MKVLFHAGLCLVVMNAIGVAHAQKKAAPRDAWPLFKGAWFEIRYPRGWKARASLPGDGGAESAFFTAPDGSAEFYVFSPLWNGTPRDIALDPETETLVSRKSTRSKNNISATTTTWTTIKAKNGRYYRSLADSQTMLNTRTVFGFKYRDQKTYRKYVRDYLRFKKSLVQFSD